MKKNSTPVETTSRRQFTRAMVTAAVAAPIAASLAACQTQSPNTPYPPSPGPSPAPSAAPTEHLTVAAGTNPCTLTVKEGLTELSFGGQIAIEEHIPPMVFDGGGSLTIDSTNNLKVQGSGSGPFTYIEDGVSDPEDQYGDIRGATVVTETTAEPFVSVVIYSGILPGAQLLLWYQNIKSPAQGDDTSYDPGTFPDNDPDVRVIGGQGSKPFRIITKKKRMDNHKSHKPNRPNRFKHTGGGGLARHFRIGQWRLVNSTGTTLVGAKGDDNYSVYLRFGHLQS